MIINNINFSAFNTNGGSHIINKKNGKYHVISVDNVGAEQGDPITTIVNAVEIDWNGAELGTINDINLGTINTTGDLLNAIKALANANKYTA